MYILCFIHNICTVIQIPYFCESQLQKKNKKTLKKELLKSMANLGHDNMPNITRMKGNNLCNIT